MMALMNGEPGGGHTLHLSEGRHSCSVGFPTAFTMKQHPLVVMVVVLVRDLLLSMGVTFPQLLVHHLLDLHQ